MPRSSRKRSALARSSESARGTSTIGNPERLRVNAPQLLQVVQDPPGSGPEHGPEVVPPGLVDLEPDEHAGQRGHRGRARVQVRGAVTLSRRLSSGGQATK